MSGALVGAGVIATPLAQIDHHSLTGHMVRHLVLMTIAAPLILLGTPEIRARHRPFRLTHRIRVRHRQGMAADGNRWHAGEEIVGWCAGTTCTIFWHIPPVFEWSM